MEISASRSKKVMKPNREMAISKSGRLPKKRYMASSSFAQILLDPVSGLYVEEYFNQRLSYERRRVERSGKPLLLVLLNIEKLQAPKSMRSVIERIGLVLVSCTRETDLKGWYEEGAVIGVLLTELSRIDKDLVEGKIQKSLSEWLDPEELSKVEITFHVFPEDMSDPKSGPHPNLKLYPEIAKRDLSKRFYFFMKRLMDVAGSVLALVILSPLFGVISILIKLTSEGPVVFRQERIGLHGNRIVFLKFRTMYVGNDSKVHEKYIESFINGSNGSGNGNKAGNGIYKIQNDRRVTLVGKILRKTSLDELPQFFNVLKGEMSLVGPRPAIPYELEKYDAWHRRRVLEVKPGISGLWQVKGRGTANFNEMVRWDLQYAREQSLWLDIKILLRTPWAVLSCSGAH